MLLSENHDKISIILFTAEFSNNIVKVINVLYLFTTYEVSKNDFNLRN